MIGSLRKMMESPGLRKKLAYAQPLILAIVTFVVASRFAEIGVDALHDGCMFKPALDVAEGKMLFRDTFTQYGALVTLLQALALKIFGPYLLVIKLQTAFFYALSIYFLWLIWKRIIPQWLATICGFIFIGMAPYYFNYPWWFLPWSSVYSLFFLTLSLYFIILFIEKRVWYYLLALGASATLTLWCRQPVGVILFCALLFFLVCWSLFERSVRNEFYHRATLFLSGFILVNAFFLAWLLFNHALKDMWLQSFVRAFMWRQQYAKARTLPTLIANFFPSCHAFNSYQSYEWSSYVWAALPAVCLILFFRTFINFFWKKHFDAKQAVVFAAVIVCLASWAQYYPVLCIRHTYWASAPMIGVFAYFVLDLLKNDNPLYRSVVILLAMGLLFKADITGRIREGKIKLHKEYITLTYPNVLKGMRVPPQDAVYFHAIASDIDDYFRQSLGSGLINLSRDALYPAFVENLRNAHPLHVHWLGFEALYPKYLAKLREYAEKQRPMIISHITPVLFDGYTVKSLCRDIYITSPDDVNSAWSVVAVRVTARELAAPANAVERDYCLDMRCAVTNAPIKIRSIAAAAYDLNGAFVGVWYPLEQTSNSITLSFAKTPTPNQLKPLNPEFNMPSSGKYQLCLTGHDAADYTKVTVDTIMNDNTCSRQIISILPPLPVK